MAEATLNETLLSYVHRKNMINTQLIQYQNSKTLAGYEQSDLAEWKNSKYSSMRTECKNIFTTKYKDQSLTYADYTEIPEYTEEVEYVDSYYEAQVEEISAWETQLEGQITTLSTELQEINSYVDSFKGILSDNIKDDYNYGEGVS